MRIPWLLFILPAPVCLAQAPFPPGMPAPRATQPASLAVEVSPAQRPSGSLSASIPQGKASSEPLILTIRDAIGRGLKYNLALVETGESVQVRRAQRLRALSALLPNVSVRPSVSEQQTNLAAFGLSGFPGLPTVVGPFTIYDARASATQSLLNFQNLRNLRAARESVRAAEFSSRDIREEVVLAVTGLYLQAVAGLCTNRSAARPGTNGRHGPPSGSGPQIGRHDRWDRCAARASGTSIRAAALVLLRRRV